MPTSFRLAFLVGILFAGPFVFFGFYLGGIPVGIGAVVTLFFYFVILYMVAFRRYF